jgi:transcriptional regulator with XRE-family HTH domain
MDNQVPGSLAIPDRMADGDFAGWLRDAMAERGMTQRVLAQLSGVDHSTISRLLWTTRQPTLGTAVALLRVLGRPPVPLVRPTALQSPRVHALPGGWSWKPPVVPTESAE